MPTCETAHPIYLYTLITIRQAIPLTENPGVIDPCRLQALMLVKQLRVTLHTASAKASP